MEKFNVWKILVLFTFVLCVGCNGSKPQGGTDTGAGGTQAEVSGTGDATSGAGTGTGGTETGGAGTGDATSGAGTGTGGTPEK
jgi:hypothetical protein